MLVLICIRSHANNTCLNNVPKNNGVVKEKGSGAAISWINSRGGKSVGGGWPCYTSQPQSCLDFPSKTWWPSILLCVWHWKRLGHWCITFLSCKSSCPNTSLPDDHFRAPSEKTPADVAMEGTTSNGARERSKKSNAPPLRAQALERSEPKTMEIVHFEPLQSHTLCKISDCTLKPCSKRGNSCVPRLLLSLPNIVTFDRRSVLMTSGKSPLKVALCHKVMRNTSKHAPGSMGWGTWPCHYCHRSKSKPCHSKAGWSPESVRENCPYWTASAASFGRSEVSIKLVRGWGSLVSSWDKKQQVRASSVSDSIAKIWLPQAIKSSRSKHSIAKTISPDKSQLCAAKSRKATPKLTRKGK